MTAIISQYTPVSVQLTSANHIPSMCAQLVQLLHKRPLFQGMGAVNACKIMILSKESDLRLVTILNFNLNQQPRNSNPLPIYEFRPAQLWTEEGHPIKRGLQMFHAADRFHMPSHAELSQSYTAIFSKIKTDWTKSHAKQHPEILFKKDPREFTLFVKKAALVDEADLIHAVAVKLSLEKAVINGGAQTSKMIYLWVSTLKIAQVQKKMGLVLK
jgi:hypothetical protein